MPSLLAAPLTTPSLTQRPLSGLTSKSRSWSGRARRRTNPHQSRSAMSEPREDSMNRNGNHQNVALLDVVEDETPETQTGPFYDSNNPVLKPAKAVEAGNRKTWKRKLIGWGFLLLLVGGAAIALYLLLRVNRVPVRVQADSRRDPQSAKSKTD